MTHEEWYKEQSKEAEAADTERMRAAFEQWLVERGGIESITERVEELTTSIDTLVSTVALAWTSPDKKQSVPLDNIAHVIWDWLNPSLGELPRGALIYLRNIAVDDLVGRVRLNAEDAASFWRFYVLSEEQTP